MRFGDVSLLRYLCYPLKVFPWVREYYHDTFWNEPSLYEHVYTGFVCNMIGSVLMRINPIAGWIFICLAFTLHVIYKEVFVDAKKRVNEVERKTFWVDLTTRIYGFLISSPVILIN